MLSSHIFLVKFSGFFNGDHNSWQDVAIFSPRSFFGLKDLFIEEEDLRPFKSMKLPLLMKSIRNTSEGASERERAKVSNCSPS